MKTRILVADAMLTAMYVVLSLLSIPLGNLKITLSGLPILLGALLFGPLSGLLIGLLGSFLEQLLTYGLTATTVLWILPAGARGLMAGLCARHLGYILTGKQIVWIAVLSSLLVTALNTAVMYADSVIYGYYSAAYVFGALAVRVALGVATALVFALVLPPLMKLVGPRVLRQ